jgi:hypothetical protein
MVEPVDEMADSFAAQLWLLPPWAHRPAVAREDRLFAPYDAQQVDRFDLIGP